MTPWVKSRFPRTNSGAPRPSGALKTFPLEEKMPPDLIHAFGVLKEACAAANHRLGTLDTRRYQLIQSACQAIRAGELAEQFPLSVWQTGSGTRPT